MGKKQVSMTMDKELHAKVVKMAKEQKRSFSSMVDILLTQAVGGGK